MKYPDINNELLLERYGHGIRLVRPDRRIKSNDKLHSVGDILQLPINTYFLDADSNIKGINCVATEICGFTSAHDAIDRSVREYADKHTARSIIHNDKKIIQTQRFDIAEDTLHRADDISYTSLTFRFPWYDNNKLVGLFGIAIVHSHRDVRYLIDNLLLLGNMGLVGSLVKNPQLILSGNIADDVYLDNREIQILRILANNSTAKKIGKKLGISNRTVEYHLEKIRIKTRTKSKTELIDWAHQHLS